MAADTEHAPDTTTIKVLFISFSETEARAIQDALAKATLAAFQLSCMTWPPFPSDAPEFKASHVILLDFDCLAGASPATFLAERNLPMGLPVVILCALEQEAQARELARDGAADYLIKGHLDSRLAEHVISYAVERHQLQTRIADRSHALAVSELRCHDMIARNADSMIVIDHRGAICYANPAAETLLGRPLDDLADLFFGFPLLEGEIIELDLVRPDGDTIVAEMRLAEIVWEGQLAWLASLRDVTERNRMELALRQSQRYYQALARNFPDGAVGLVDPDLRYIVYDGAILTELGLSAGMCEGKRLGDDFPPEIVTCDEPMLRAALAGEARTVEVVRDDRTFRVQTLPVRDEENNIFAAMVVSRDITERKTVEERLRYRVDIEHLVASLSTDFIALAPDQIDMAIQRALRLVGESTGVDRSYIGLFSADWRATLTHEWCAPSIDPQKHSVQAMPIAELPWFSDLIRGHQVMHVPRVSAMPPEAWRERAIFESQAIQSILCVPMTSDATLIGFLGFDMVRSERVWAEEDITLFQVMGEIFASALDRKRRQEALEASEARFRTVISNAPMVIFAFDRDGLLTLLEGNRLEALGIRTGEWLGRSVFGLYGDQSDQFAACCRRALAGESFSVVTVIRASEALRFETWFTPLFDATGAVAGGIGVALDITERYKAQEAERDQRVLAEALRETASALTSTLDPGEVMRRILETVGRVVPHESATILIMEGNMSRVAYMRGRHEPLKDTLFRDLVFPSSLFTLRTMIETGKACLIANVLETPEWRHIEGIDWIRSYLGVPIRAYGEIIGFLNLDSSAPNFFTPEHAERLQAVADQAAIALQNAQLYARVVAQASELEQRVRERTLTLESERGQLNAILESISEGVIHAQVSPTRWSTRFANRAFYTMLGYSHEAIFTEDFPRHVLVFEDGTTWEQNLARLRRALLARDIVQAELRMRRQDGSTFDASVTVTRIASSREDVLDVVAVVRDISKEKNLQEQKDRFIANASHELRTPLTNLKMRLYLLGKQPHLLPEHAQVLEQVTNRMQELVDDLLDVSRFERGIIRLERDSVALQDLIADVILIQQPHAERKGLRLFSHMPADPIITSVDASRITQVVTNLVVNAINYTPEGGQVAVELTTVTDQSGKAVVIRVRDTGIGIPTHLHAQIFEPFFRVNVGVVRGTGLGLTISREIVRLHGGKILVESKENIGTTFTVVLPIHGPEAEEQSEPAMPPN